MVSVLPIRRMSGVRQASPVAATSTLMTREWKKAVENRTSAVFRSPLPRAMLTRLPAPCPIMKPKAWKIDCTPSTTPIAALALVPRRPTK